MPDADMLQASKIIKSLEGDIAKCTERVTELEDWLKKNGKHMDPGCFIVYGPLSGQCNEVKCGLKKLLGGSYVGITK